MVSFIASFGERKSLGRFHLDNETVLHFAGFRNLTFCLNTCSVGLGLCQMQQSSMDVSLNMCLFILAP